MVARRGGGRGRRALAFARSALGRSAVRGAAGAAGVAVAVWLAAIACAPWSPRPGWCRRSASLAGGMDRADTLWYHMPLATRFAHGAHFGTIDYFDPIFFASFYPANSEVVHAVPLLAFDRDILSPLINLGWLALGLTAAYAIGRPYGVGPAEPDRRRDRARRPEPGRVPGGRGAQRHRRRRPGPRARSRSSSTPGRRDDPRRGPMGAPARRSRRPGLAAGPGGGHEALLPRARRRAVRRPGRDPRPRRAAAHRALVRAPGAAHRRLLVRAQPGRDRQPDPVHDLRAAATCRCRSAPSSSAPGSRSSTTPPTSTSGRTGSFPGSTTRSASCGRWCSPRSSAPAIYAVWRGERAAAAGARRRRPVHRGRLRVHAADRGRGGGAADRVRVERPLHRAGGRGRARAAALPADRPAQRARPPDHARPGSRSSSRRRSPRWSSGSRATSRARSRPGSRVLVAFAADPAGCATAAGWAPRAPLAWVAGPGGAGRRRRARRRLVGAAPLPRAPLREPEPAAAARRRRPLGARPARREGRDQRRARRLQPVPLLRHRPLQPGPVARHRGPGRRLRADPDLRRVAPGARRRRLHPRRHHLRPVRPRHAHRHQGGAVDARRTRPPSRSSATGR